jgi:hypothetical protein
LAVVERAEAQFGGCKGLNASVPFSFEGTYFPKVFNTEQTWHRENALIAQRLQKGSFEAVPSARWGPKMESWLNGAEESMEVSGKGMR